MVLSDNINILAKTTQSTKKKANKYLQVQCKILCKWGRRLHTSWWVLDPIVFLYRLFCCWCFINNYLVAILKNTWQHNCHYDNGVSRSSAHVGWRRFFVPGGSSRPAIPRRAIRTLGASLLKEAPTLELVDNREEVPSLLASSVVRPSIVAVCCSLVMILFLLGWRFNW